MPGGDAALLAGPRGSVHGHASRRPAALLGRSALPRGPGRTHCGGVGRGAWRPRHSPVPVLEWLNECGNGRSGRVGWGLKAAEDGATLFLRSCVEWKTSLLRRGRKGATPVAASQAGAGAPSTVGPLRAAAADPAAIGLILFWAVGPMGWPRRERSPIESTGTSRASPDVAMLIRVLAALVPWVPHRSKTADIRPGTGCASLPSGRLKPIAQRAV